MALLENIPMSVSERAATTLTWSEPETKLWVASRDGEYAGMIEYLAGHFVATGATGHDLGSYSSLDSAMASVDLGASRRRLPEGVLSNVAIVSAVVALSLAGMSLSMIAA